MSKAAGSEKNAPPGIWPPAPACKEKAAGELAGAGAGNRAAIDKVVAVDRIGEQAFVVTNIRTCESINLPRGYWMLLRDPESDKAALVGVLEDGQAFCT